MATFEIRGTTLEYREEGSGEPVVFVHGSASDLRTWDLQIPAIAKHYHTVRYSRRYHWPNPPIERAADYAMDEHVADLQDFVRSRCDTPVHLVGHSYGAFVCLLLAIRAPELARTLVLAEPPVITLFVANSPQPAEIARLFLTRPRTAVAIIRFGVTGLVPTTAAARRGDMDAAMRIFGAAVLGRTFYDRLPAARLEQIRVNAIRAEFVGSGLAPLEAAAVRRVATPTLLLEGQHSPSLFHRLSERLAELLPSSERHLIAEASHSMHEDNAGAFHRHVLSFLAQHAAA
jgi:pimeloyl-ACP methyl ester carboxylesterase